MHSSKLNAAKARVRRLVRAFGYDVRQRRPELIDYLNSRAINLVIDVGANSGGFGAELRADGYSGSILSFEPADQPFQDLAALTANDPKWKAKKLALGQTSGWAKLNVSRFDTFSSLLPQTTNAAAFEKYSAVDHAEIVEVCRLDDVCKLQGSDRPFLKIDTQGFEQQVLSGARNTLSSMLGVLLEIPIVHMYEQVWSFEEASRFMRSAGFVLAQVKPVNYLWRQDPVSVSELDCLFRRMNEAFDGIAFGGFN